MKFIRTWIFRLLLLVVFIVALVAASENSTEVTLSFLDYQSPAWPVSWWMLAAFVIGVLFGTLLNLMSNTRLRMRQRSAERKVAQTTRELNQVRAEPLNESDKETDNR